MTEVDSEAQEQTRTDMQTCMEIIKWGNRILKYTGKDIAFTIPVESRYRHIYNNRAYKKRTGKI